MKLVLSFLLIVCLFQRHLVEAQNGISEDKLEKTENIIKKFFSTRGLPIDKVPLELVGKYHPEVLEHMAALTDPNMDSYEDYRLNTKLNKLIYQIEWETHVEGEFPDQPDGAMFRALDLMVPNSEKFPIYEKAKKALRDFYIQQPELCHKLLDRFRMSHYDYDLTTEDVMQNLRHLYNHLIPLARLQDLPELNKSVI